MIVDAYHPIGGHYKQLGSALKLSETTVDLGRIPAPALGEHSISILQEMGLDNQTIEELQKSEVVSSPSDKEKTQ